jgi:hypothetical protein
MNVFDFELLARREGEAWARGRLEQLRLLGRPIPPDWPGLMALAYLTAEDLATVRAIDPRDVQKLALRINEYAERAWAALVQAA